MLHVSFELRDIICGVNDRLTIRGLEEFSQ